jgi:hypothetical protein
MRIVCRKYHLTNWQLVSMEKEYGGLVIPSIRELNLCLLGSWVRRYAVDKEKILKMLIDFKYNASAQIFSLVAVTGYLIFGRGFFGLPMWLRWGLYGR